MDQSETPRSAWVQPLLAWSAVVNARARIAGPVEQAPSHVGDIKLNPLSRQFFAWWMEARGMRAMPAPDDVSPRALVELLPYFRLLRWEGEENLVFRIIGSALVEAIGFDLTGMCTFGPDPYEGRAEDIQRLKLMHSHPCGLLLHRDLTRADGSVYRCELINLPVSGGDDGKDRIVGTVAPCAPVEESELDVKLAPPLTLRRAAFIDIGFGLPEGADFLFV